MSRPIDINAKIDRCAYYPGEVVTIVCNVSNKSSVGVIPRVTLRQIQTFKQLMAAKNNEKTVRRQTTHAVKKQRLEGSLTEPGLSTTHIFHVEIPIDIPISVDCPILTVSYDLHLTVDIPSAIDLHLDLPIMITTKNVVNQYKPYNSEYKMT
ncbi:unnamed protein product [Oppiella nova]|uniref:Arrestin C-terminal-like domain-containing protein n=1 Tax=Oppiella nova TaxID=334625 RepID=A0A7R9MEW1_9ACAR|nr:unnamed protein product [Oppiella nova]CAG2174889.1 unnamed protein product [Oppiella nova]